ncbi:MAG TPA: SDR family oxidoreductase [Polyangiaceae bacterium]|jgi:uncharacterized protein YbjT (DUF2867 family)
MKVLVIGATGLTGTHLINKLLARGDDVTALVRNPSSYDVKHDRLRVAQGEARDLASLERACDGQDAVISAFGPRTFKKDDLQEVFMKNLIDAMTKSGVKRLVNLSAWGAGDSYAQAGFVAKIFFALVLSNLYIDKNRGETLLFASSLDYINVRPGRLTNGAARGHVRAALAPDGMRPWLTREDLADFMIAQLTDDTWVKKSPLIAYG